MVNVLIASKIPPKKKGCNQKLLTIYQKNPLKQQVDNEE